MTMDSQSVALCCSSDGILTQGHLHLHSDHALRQGTTSHHTTALHSRAQNCGKAAPNSTLQWHTSKCCAAAVTAFVPTGEAWQQDATLPKIKEYIVAGVTSLVEYGQRYKFQLEKESWIMVVGLSQAASQVDFPEQAPMHVSGRAGQA